MKTASADNAKHQPLPPPERLLQMLHTMLRIRLFEERVLADYMARKIPGFTHSYVGEEAAATGMCAVLGKDDYITSTHRGHGHAIAKGVGLNPLMAELYGKTTGVCHGRGGSMHVADFSLGMLGANGIVGGGFGLAAGAGISIQFRKSNQVAVCFFGDGGINKGTFHEAMNLAAVMKLPVVFACENNQFAQYTAMSRTTSIQELSTRAVAYGIPGITVDGNDVLAVYGAAREAVDRARSGEGPSLVVMETYRFYGHSVGDAEAYRSKDEVAERRSFDPIPRFEKVLLEHKVIGDAERMRMWEEVKTEVEESVAFAVASPDPDPASALDDLFTPILAGRGR
jgi:TPP-dependent pyruvate/acetoin dehydrogenase alpha subunit